VLTVKQLAEKGLLIGEVKPKCRIVVLGFDDWRAIIEGLETDSPTVNRLSGRIVGQIYTILGWRTLSGDVSTAFLRGDDLPEPLYSEVPRECGVDRGKVFRIVRGVFGLLDAPRLWYRRCRRGLERLGAVVCPLDACGFLWHEGTELSGILVFHVDDMRAPGSAKWFEEVFGRIQSLYVFGDWEEGSFRYAGVTYVFDEKGLAYGLPDCIDKLELVQEKDFGKLVNAASPGPLDTKGLLPAGITVFRVVMGALQWLLYQGRPDLVGAHRYPVDGP